VSRHPRTRRAETYSMAVSEFDPTIWYFAQAVNYALSIHLVLLTSRFEQSANDAVSIENVVSVNVRLAVQAAELLRMLCGVGVLRL
jgi:hypothetical protein